MIEGNKGPPTAEMNPKITLDRITAEKKQETELELNKVSFFVQCTKMQLITLQNFNIQTI